MLNFAFNSPKPLHLLCLGAHSDDIEIGAGGTILRLIAERKVDRVDWVVFSANGVRGIEASKSAQLFLNGLDQINIETYSFQDGFFPYNGAEIKLAFEALKRKLNPDIVLTHHRDDLHQDHRVLAELTWNSFRNHIVMEYEIPKYDGNPYSPNTYVTLDEPTCRKKVENLAAGFPSQAGKPWFTPDTFMSTLRLRGVECASPTRHAEAFICRKVVI